MLNAQEEKRLAELEAKYGNVAQAQPIGLSPQEEKRLQELEAKYAQPKSQGSAPESFVQNVGQAVSFGYLPQIQAATEPYIQKAFDYFGGDVDKELKEKGFQIKEAPEKSYVQRRDETIKKLEQVSKESPKAALAGQVAGSIVGGVGLGGLFKTAGTVGGRIAQAAKSGALIGAVRNPGDTEGEVDKFQLKDRAINIVKDAATGAVLQGGLEGVGKVGKILRDAPDSIKKWSQIKSLKASGAMLKDFRKQFGNKKAFELGQSMIDNGVISVGDDIAQIAEKSEGLKNIAGQKIGQIYEQADNIVDDIYNKSPMRKMQLDESNINLDKLSQKFLYNIKQKYTGKAGGEKIINSIASELEQIGMNGEVNLSKVKEIRSSIDELINYSRATQELKPIQEELMNLRGTLQDSVRKRLAAIDKISSTDLAKQFSTENKLFSNFAEISKMAKDKLARESSNAAFGLRERISGGAGTAVGAYVGSSLGPVGAAAGAAIGGSLGAITTKVGRKYGTPFVAISANKIAKALQNNPNALGTISGSLIKAAETSPKEFVNAVNILMSDPKFKTKVRELK